MKHGLAAAFFLGLAVASTAAMTGCCGKKGSSALLGTTGELVTINEAGVKINAPGGWVRYPAGRWVRFKPSDNMARLAFVTFDRPGEATALIGQMASQLELGSVVWRADAENGTIGPDKLPARIGKGDCKIGASNEPCYVEYATVNPGRNTQLLVVYVVNTAKGAMHKANAQAAVASLSKI
ncbi:MAG: hypothetical protein EOO75_16710 [Myxococcales bacterium]|nr:MAG: hypothetical protein EOO75_16710 [Myxococcales bacterium]